VQVVGVEGHVKRGAAVRDRHLQGRRRVCVSILV
jgi:hypothetical protein